MTSTDDLVSRAAALEAIQSLRHAAASNFGPGYFGAEGVARTDSFLEAYKVVRGLPAASSPTPDGVIKERGEDKEVERALRDGLSQVEPASGLNPSDFDPSRISALARATAKAIMRGPAETCTNRKEFLDGTIPLIEYALQSMRQAAAELEAGTAEILIDGVDAPACVCQADPEWDYAPCAHCPAVGVNGEAPAAAASIPGAGRETFAPQLRDFDDPRFSAQEAAEIEGRFERAFYDAGGFAGTRASYAARIAKPIVLALLAEAREDRARDQRAEREDAQRPRPEAASPVVDATSGGEAPGRNDGLAYETDDRGAWTWIVWAIQPAGPQLAAIASTEAKAEGYRDVVAQTFPGAKFFAERAPVNHVFGAADLRSIAGRAAVKTARQGFAAPRPSQREG